MTGAAGKRQKMTDLNNSAVFILLLLTVVMVAYYLLLMVTGYYARKQEPVTAFTRITKEHSIEQAHAKIAGGLVWGQDRTLWTAPNIVLGVEPQNVRVTHYEPVPFAFLEDETNIFTDVKKKLKLDTAIDAGLL